MDKNVGWSAPGGEPRPSPIASPASHHLPLRSVHAVGLVHHISPGRIRARALAGALLHPIARTIAERHGGRIELAQSPHHPSGLLVNVYLSKQYL